jgi:hypothetical protein
LLVDTVVAAAAVVVAAAERNPPEREGNHTEIECRSRQS